jgi:hypothetical protein
MPASPVVSSSALLSLLAALRHPSSDGSFTGKSLLHTLEGGGEEAAMHPTDRAHFFNVIVPFLAHLVLRLPDLFPADGCCLPLMSSGNECTVSLSALQCAVLVAAQFFSLLPPKAAPKEGVPPSAAADDDDEEDGGWPYCNMGAFFSAVRAPVMTAKHMMLFNYFARIERAQEFASLNSRFVTFHRRVLSEEKCALVNERNVQGRSAVTSAAAKAASAASAANAGGAASSSDGGDDTDALSSCSLPLSRVEYREVGCIEEAAHALQADFANAYIGGGVLYTGCVQEEIRFCLSPECLVSTMLLQRMADDEAIVLCGVKMYSHYSGYGRTLRFGGDCADEGLERDDLGRVSNAIVAIDALDFNHCGGSVRRTVATQWREENLRREILKAYAGFSVPQAPQLLGNKFQYDAVATGNWVSPVKGRAADWNDIS